MRSRRAGPLVCRRLGISRVGEILDIGVREEIVNKSGSWFSYGEDRLGQGRERVKQFLQENPDLMEKIETEIRVKLGLFEESTEENTTKEKKSEEVTS